MSLHIWYVSVLICLISLNCPLVEMLNALSVLQLNLPQGRLLDFGSWEGKVPGTSWWKCTLCLVYSALCFLLLCSSLMSFSSTVLVMEMNACFLLKICTVTSFLAARWLKWHYWETSAPPSYVEWVMDYTKMSCLMMTTPWIMSKKSCALTLLYEQFLLLCHCKILWRD